MIFQQHYIQTVNRLHEDCSLCLLLCCIYNNFWWDTLFKNTPNLTKWFLFYPFGRNSFESIEIVNKIVHGSHRLSKDKIVRHLWLVQILYLYFNKSNMSHEKIIHSESASNYIQYCQTVSTWKKGSIDVVTKFFCYSIMNNVILVKVMDVEEKRLRLPRIDKGAMRLWFIQKLVYFFLSRFFSILSNYSDFAVIAPLKIGFAWTNRTYYALLL